MKGHVPGGTPIGGFATSKAALATAEEFCPDANPG